MDFFYLSAFQVIKPLYEQNQTKLLEWIAKAHTKSAFPQANQDDPEALRFLEKIHIILKKIGLGPGKIEQRSIQCIDFQHEDWESMDIFRLDKSPQGLGLKKRMEFFSESTEKVFFSFYENKNLPSHLVHVTCTGYASPTGAQKLVSSRKSLTTTVTNAYHMGCYGALPAIRMGEGFLALEPKDSVDIVHTEICSLHMNPSIHTKEQLVIESLFADGFAKYTLTKQKKEPASFKILTLLEEIIPDSGQDMSWICHDFGFAMHVAKEVPGKILEHLPSYLTRLCVKANISSEDIRKAIFAIHPGGPKIIEQLSQALALSPLQSQHSHQILKSCGNMSSATLPHIWKKILEDPGVKEGMFVISLGFGPGLTISGSIFQKEN